MSADAPLLPLLVGTGLAVAVGLSTWLAGLARERSFYPTIAVVVATYYVLFGVLGGDHGALLRECLVALGFAALAVVAFRRNLWWAVLAIGGHGAFDLVHGLLIDNPGVPSYWPPFCLAYDVAAAAGLAWLLRRGWLPAKPNAGTTAR